MGNDVAAAPLIGQLDAENAVIGSLLIDESIAPQLLSSVSAADFGNDENRKIFQAARLLLREGSPVDPITIRGKLGVEIEQRLIQLMEVTPTSANWREYASAMRDQASLSRIRDIARELTAATTMEDCRSSVAALGELMATGSRIDAWTLREALQRFQAAQVAERKREYVSFGLSILDEGTYIEPGDVVVIGGEPSSGKTALALQLAYHMAKRWRVGFFSLETGNAKLTDRLVANAMGIDFNVIKRQDLDERAWGEVAVRGDDFSQRQLTFVPASGMSAAQIQVESRARGFQVVFIDYVQLIEPEGDPRATQAQIVAGISRALHTFAQNSGTLVVELAQLSRPLQKQWREPDMHDLKESGQLEQDADAIFMIYRPRPGGDYDDNKTRILKIAKQKEGRLGKWPLAFDGAHQRFALMAGPDARAIQQKFMDAGKAAKTARRAQLAGQQTLTEIQETGDEPF